MTTPFEITKDEVLNLAAADVIVATFKAAIKDDAVKLVTGHIDKLIK